KRLSEALAARGYRQELMRNKGNSGAVGSAQREPLVVFGGTFPFNLRGEKAIRESRRGRSPFDVRASGGGVLTQTTTPQNELSEKERKELRELVGPGDELWILQLPDHSVDSRDDTRPGSGSLVAKLGEGEIVPVPLEHTAVNASISGYIATVEVAQQFHNPFDQKIEASYVFPLPQDAAVTDFLMTVGERTIRGVIRNREEAQKIYTEAKRQGYVASILTQERPNIFTQKVANIEPGKRIDVAIQYFNTLRYERGEYEFVFPMVAGPRFNPPHQRDGVGAVPHGDWGTSSQSTEVSYLRPYERSGHDVSLTLDIDAGVAIEGVQSVNHVVAQESLGFGRHRVTLCGSDSIPNKDFVLRFGVAGDRIKSNLLVEKDESGSYFSLMVYPPQDLESLERQPVELIFVLDCSGSMSGEPLAQAKRSISWAIRRLDAYDSFQIIRFSSKASQLGSKPLVATDKNKLKGLRYLDALDSTGGTMMIEGIRAALDVPHDDQRLRLVGFFTDGYIGNEDEIFAEVYRRRGDARIFSFGVGNSVNRHLLEGMARLGRGAAAFVSLNENSTEAVDEFFRSISHPALTDLEIDWGDLNVRDVFPKRLPDLFVGRPILLTGRIEGQFETGTTIRISGHTGSLGVRDIEIPVTRYTARQQRGIEKVWARRQIQTLSDAATYSRGDELPKEIERLALDHNLLSNYTAFLAVDSLTKTEGEQAGVVPVSVPVPEGVSYDTTVGK
ncbi:MAG: VIT domain-containing protein, partial [Planctomycetota bacterium]